MTLKEAIYHARTKAEELERIGCGKCAEEHRQLAAWLSDYESILEWMRSPTRLSKENQTLYTQSNNAINFLEQEVEKYDYYLKDGSISSPRMNKSKDNVVRVLETLKVLQHEWLRLNNRGETV